MPAAKFNIWLCLATAVCVSVSFCQCAKGKVYDRFPIPPTIRANSEFFGCKINGLPFVPKAPSETGLGNCTYGRSYAGDAGFTFQLTSNSHQQNCRLESVTLVLDSIQLVEGSVFQLGAPGSKKSYASYSLVNDCSNEKTEMFTDDDNPGQVSITKFDRTLKFVSGSFSFTVKDPSGTRIRISEGLFDKLITN